MDFRCLVKDFARFRFRPHSYWMSMDSTDTDVSRNTVRRNTERWLEIEADFITVDALILHLKASFLIVLLRCSGKWDTETGNLKPLLTGILVGLQNADLDLQRLWLDFFIRDSSAFFIWRSLGFFNRSSMEKSLFMPVNMDGLLSGVIERLELLQPDMDEIYTVLSKSSEHDTDMIDEDTSVWCVQKEQEKIASLLRVLRFICDSDFVYLRKEFEDSQRKFLSLNRVHEIPTCFENDIKALFSGGLLLSHHLWLFPNNWNFCGFESEMEKKKKKMTDDAAEPLEDEARFENKLKIIETKLEMIQTRTKLMWPLRNEVQALRLKVILLGVLLISSKEQWHTEDGSLKALLTRIRSVFQSLDAPLSSTQETLQLLKPDIKQVYNILSKSSIFISVTSAKGVMKKLNSLQENMEHLLRFNAELVASVKEDLEAVRKCLRFLTSILKFTEKRCCKPEDLRDLLIHAEFPVIKISCLLYLCPINDKTMNDMKMQLSSELQKFSSAQPREIYVKALKASKSEQGNSTLVDEFDLCFLDSLRDYILELSDTELSFMTCNKNQILSLHEQLRILTVSFALDKSSEDHSEHQQMSDSLLKRINAAIIDTGCVMYLLHNDEKNRDEARELKITVSQLQDIIKIAKEDAIKAFDIYLPKALRPKFSRTTAVQDFIGSLLEISQELLNAEVDSMCPLKDQLQVVGDEILSLNEAFNKFTAKHLSHHGELRIQSTHFSDIDFLIRYVITSFFYRGGTLWSHKLGLFNVIEEIRLIKMELKYLQNKMTRDTSVNAAEKNTTTDNVVIFEDEAGIWEQLTNGSKELHILSIEDRPKSEDQLRWLETNVDLICPLKDEVQTLGVKSSFLKVFLSFKGKRNIEDGNLQALLIHIQTVFENADQDLQRLWVESPKKMDGLLCGVLEKYQLLKPDIQQVYTMLSKSSRSITDMNSKAIMENINFLLEKTEDLLRCNAELIAPIHEELKAVQKKMRFLRNFLGFIAKRCSKLENLIDLLLHAEFLADNISCLLYLCSFNDMINGQMVNEMKKLISSEVQKFSPAEPDIGKIYINSLKASKSTERNSTLVDEFDLGFLDSLRDCILELSDTKLSFITSNKEQILSLIEELRFVTTFFAMDQSLEEHFHQMSNNLLDRIVILIIDTGCVIYALHNLDQDGDKSSDIKIAVSNLHNMVKIAKKDAKKVYGMYLPKSLWSIYPTTNGQGFISFLLRNLKELQNTELKLTAGSLFQNADQILVAPFKHHIKVALKELLSLKEEFSKTAKHPSQFEDLQGQWTLFIGVAYQTEYVIDSFLGGDAGPLYHHKLELFVVIEEIKTIKMELEAIKNKMKDKSSMQKSSCSPSQISQEANSPKNDAVPRFKERMADEQTVSKLVIFGKEAKEIIEKLTNGSQKLNFVSIVGMAGIGKTTLADSVFQHFSSTYHFHVLGRCFVSQVHDKTRMLRDILHEVTSESKQYSDDELEQRLKQSLLGRRYLIFLDDMWDGRPWEDIKACFPDGNNGSRIMFTSRSVGIASQAGLADITYTCRLWPLSDDKCWEMLQVKVFGSESCPPALESVGHEIAANCKGLPLTVDLIAGILRATKRENWKEVAESMMRHLLIDDPQRRCQNVLELSYKDLPDELKPCFLYFAAFPEDVDVPARKLFWLWIAEGFVQLQKDDLRSLEDAAEDILNDLISRSLVIVSRSRRLGGVKGTRVHDLLHEFAFAKAREESFMMVLDHKANFSSLLADDYQWQEQYRLSISYPWTEFHESSRARAVICFIYGLNLSGFKLLRVLDIREDSPAIFALIHLRFLAIRRSGYGILSKIHMLRNLETFILKKYWGKSEYLLLDKVCNMVRLRHFKFGYHFYFRYSTEKILEKSSLFDNLRTLCGLRLSYAEEIEKILKLMPNLVKLKVEFYNPDGKCHPFPKLDFLKKVESLDVTHRDSKDPCKITSFPPYLKKLAVREFQLPWAEISKMGNFEYLEVLKLKCESFEGLIWDMVGGQFPKLKCLSLHYLDIEAWNTSEDELSCLEQLHVKSCTELKELPSCLAESATLQVIKLEDCLLAENSANRIKEGQQETGYEISVDISRRTQTV